MEITADPKTLEFMQHYSVGMYDYAIKMNEPFTIYRPRIFIDGNQWCALYGENIQDGVAGFGGSPEKAAEDFNRNWALPLPEPPEGEEEKLRKNLP